MKAHRHEKTGNADDADYAVIFRQDNRIDGIKKWKTKSEKWKVEESANADESFILGAGLTAAPEKNLNKNWCGVDKKVLLIDNGDSLL
jgi:hypothetical protein